MRQYELWWAQLPQPAGRRPVLLLSRKDSYQYLNRFVAAEITTTIRNIAIEVPLGPREGLSKKCVANLDSLRTVSREALVERIGTVAAARRVEVKRALGYAFAWEELIDSSQ